MTATQLQQILEEADRKLSSPAPARRELGLGLLRRVERWLASGEPFEIELPCANCTRPRRSWFATGVADLRLHPLCSRACIADWKASHQGARVLMRDGRDFVERPERARRAA